MSCPSWACSSHIRILWEFVDSHQFGSWSWWPCGWRRRSEDAIFLELRGLESCWGHGCLSLVFACVVQVAVSATSWSLGQRSQRCLCWNRCDLETPTTRQPRPELGCCNKERKKERKKGSLWDMIKLTEKDDLWDGADKIITLKRFLKKWGAMF